MTVRPLPPRGRYLAREVGRLAGVSGDRIGQWARREYIRSSVSSDVPRVYCFQDVAEAMVVHELVDRGVSLPSIKYAIENLREEWGSDWPLTHARLSVPRDTFAPSVIVREGDRLFDIGRRKMRWSGILDFELDLDQIAEDLHRGGWAAREVPDLTHIEVDPDRLSGRPVIRGKRIAAEDAARIASTPGGERTLRRDYGLTAAEVRDAQLWWARVTDFEPAA